MHASSMTAQMRRFISRSVSKCIWIKQEPANSEFTFPQLFVDGKNSILHDCRFWFCLRILGKTLCVGREMSEEEAMSGRRVWWVRDCLCAVPLQAASRVCASPSLLAQPPHGVAQDRSPSAGVGPPARPGPKLQIEVREGGRRKRIFSFVRGRSFVLF
jgi:hypothetical protein